MGGGAEAAVPTPESLNGPRVMSAQFAASKFAPHYDEIHALPQEHGINGKNLTEKGSKFRIAPGRDPLDPVEMQPSERSSMPGELMIFKGFNINVAPISHVIERVEGHIATSKGVRRALTRKVDEHDVYICGNARSGEGIVALLLRLLATNAEALSFDGSRESRLQPAPLLESKLYDSTPKQLDEAQSGSICKLFKTTATHKALSGIIRDNKKTKFVAVLRDPKDYRVAFFNHLERLYEFERKSNRSLPAFKMRFSPEDLAELPLSGSHAIEGEVSYEANLAAWVDAAAKRDNVCVVFFEDLVCNLELVVKRLARFLDLSEVTDREVLQKIYLHASLKNLEQSYGPFHPFSASDLSVAVGSGINWFSHEANAFMNQRWIKEVKSFDNGLSDYAALYTRATRRSYPFTYKTVIPYDDNLVADTKTVFERIFCGVPYQPMDGARWLSYRFSTLRGSTRRNTSATRPSSSFSRRASHTANESVVTGGFASS